jgi:cytokinin dehydrogenase
LTGDNARYREALRALVACGVPFATLGSAGLAALFPRLDEAYPLPDCDVLLPASPSEALRFAAWASGQGWAVSCWGEPWSPGWTPADLAGKRYLRASRDGLQLDATFDAPALDAAACIEGAIWVDGVPVCPLEDLWFSKFEKGYVAGRRFADAYGLQIPAGAIARASAPPAIDSDPGAIDACASDWSLARHGSPRGVVTPDSVDALARVFLWASATSSRVTVQGRRRSAALQSLADGGVVVSTARLDRVLALGDGWVTVEAGLPWDRLVALLLPLGIVPPVLTSYLPATVGGTLSTAAFSRGSHLHGLQLEHVLALEVVTGDGRVVGCSPSREAWLFDAALGGLGRFGTIASATLALVAAPTRLRVARRSLAGLAELPGALAAAAREPRCYHVTSFPLETPRGHRWDIVEARVVQDGDGLDEAPDGGTVPFASYVAPPRPEAPLRSSQWLHLFVPLDGLVTLLARYEQVLSLGGGDGVQVLPVLKRRDLTASLARLPLVPDGSLVAGVCLVREHAGRDPAHLDEETRSLALFAASLGATSTLGGTLPDAPDSWRAHLGASADAVLETIRRADPARVLGGQGTRALTSPPVAPGQRPSDV